MLFVSLIVRPGLKLGADEYVGSDSPGPATKNATVVSGTWGDLQYFEVDLVAPKWIVETFELPSADTAWRFPGWEADRLSAAISSMPFAPADFHWLQEPDRVLLLEDEVRLYPPASFLIGMNPDQRRAVHRVLMQWEENAFHHQPILISSEDSKRWFRSAGLSAETADLIASLCFEHEGRSIFTEVEVVMSQLGSREAEYRFIRSLTRTRSLIARLRLTEQSDLASIALYWRGYGKRKVVTPILEAVAMTKGVDHLDILHLLPPLPRKLLNTYPDFNQSRSGRLPDSRWIAANFFRFDPSSRFFDPKEVSRELAAMYRVVDDEPRFGDLVVIDREGDPEPLQMAIQIADDIVFTKSGHGVFAPFVMTKMTEMLRTNSRHEGRLRVKRLRHVMAD